MRVGEILNERYSVEFDDYIDDAFLYDVGIEFVFTEEIRSDCLDANCDWVFSLTFC